MAIEQWRSLNRNSDLATTELEAVHLLGPDHLASVVDKEAKDIFEQLGAQPLLAKLTADSTK